MPRAPARGIRKSGRVGMEHYLHQGIRSGGLRLYGGEALPQDGQGHAAAGKGPDEVPWKGGPALAQETA